MSTCSKRLDPLFIELREKSMARDQYDPKSDEYLFLDKECRKIYADITSVFNHYNPGFKQEEAARKKREKERRGMGYK